MVYDTSLWLWAVSGSVTNLPGAGSIYCRPGPSCVAKVPSLDTQSCPFPGCSNGEPQNI